MRRALELAARGWGRVSPNPLVGCVLVRDGRVVAEGWHEGPGYRARRSHGPAGRRRSRRRGHGLRDARALRPSRPHPAVRPGADRCWRRGRDRGHGGSEPHRGRQRVPSAPGRRPDRRGRTFRRRSDPAERRLPCACPHRPAVRDPEDGIVPGWEGRRSGRVFEMDHRGGCAGGRAEATRVVRRDRRRLGHGSRRRPAAHRPRSGLRVGAAADPSRRGSVRPSARRPASVRCGRADARGDDGAHDHVEASGMGGRRSGCGGARSRHDRRRLAAGAGRDARQARRARCVARGRSHPGLERRSRRSRRSDRPVSGADAGRRSRGSGVARRKRIRPDRTSRSRRHRVDHPSWGRT